MDGNDAYNCVVTVIVWGIDGSFVWGLTVIVRGWTVMMQSWKKELITSVGSSLTVTY